MTDMTVHQAIQAVMADVREVRKEERNTAPGGNYLFRGVDAVTNRVGPVLRRHGVIIAPKVLDWQYGTVTVGAKQTVMSHSRLLIEFTWYGPAGDHLPTVFAGEAFDSGDKATAKAHSVAYRTAMIETLCLPTDEKDPNEDTYERSAHPARSVDDATAARNELVALLNRTGRSVDEAIALFDKHGFGDLERSTDIAAIRQLTAYYRQMAGEKR